MIYPKMPHPGYLPNEYCTRENAVPTRQGTVRSAGENGWCLLSRRLQHLHAVPETRTAGPCCLGHKFWMKSEGQRGKTLQVSRSHIRPKGKAGSHHRLKFVPFVDISDRSQEGIHQELRMKWDLPFLTHQ